MTSLALNFLGGAPFQLLYESVKIALGKCRKFRTHLENLEITLDCLQPWIIQQIRANNVQLNLPNDLIHDLEVKMEEGRELVHRLSRLGIWDIRIWGNCYNCIRPNYAKQLTELDRSLRRLLEILKLEALTNVQENLLLARNHKDKQNEMDKNVLELLKVHNEVLKMQHEICDMMRLQHEAVQRLLVDGTQIMRGEATPAPAPCPVIGFVFRMLCDVVTRVKVKNTMCRRLVQEFKSTLDFLKPLMEEMTECNTLLHLPEQEQEKLIIQMRKGVELIYKCSKVRKWASYKSHTCTKDLLILDGYLQELFYKMSLQIAKHEKEALVSIKSMEAVITKVKESGGVVQNQIQAVLSKPEPPLLEGRLDVLHTHVRVEKIEGNSVRQNEIVIPSSSQVTETSSPITGLDVQETTDINETMNDPSLSRSAPTNVLSSSAVSPQRSTLNDVFPFFDQFQGPVLLSPNKPALPSSSLSPLHSPTLRSPRFSPNDSIANAHPHPLPLPLPQPQNVGHNECLSTMKGQWKKGRLIGRGTFGSVYVAFNRETGALCAMKEVDLNPDDPKSAECIKQLEQEIKVLGTLKHPNIVQYYGSEVIDDHFYMYLEYVHPGPINKYVQEHIGTMSESVVRYFTRQILSGLAFLHDTKTIHRDIKAANLLVDTSGVVKLADFGMAKHLDAHSFGLSLKKSPYWMAPEVILALNTDTDSDPNLALAVDIWSLGCTIIEMFDGKPPWSECEGPQAVFNVLNKSPDIPEALSAEGKEFLSLCFRRSPAERPSAKKLLEHSFLRNSSDQNLCKWLMSINPFTLAINSNHTISLPGSPLHPGMEIEIMKESSCFPLVDKEHDLQSQFSGVTVPEVLHCEQQVVHNDPLESKDQCPPRKTLDCSNSGSNKANEFDGQSGRSNRPQHFNSEKRCQTETQEAEEKEVAFRTKSNPTPTTTGRLSTGTHQWRSQPLACLGWSPVDSMQSSASQSTSITTSTFGGSTISGNSQFSARSGGDDTCPDGQILPSANLRIFGYLELKIATRNFRSDTVLGEGGFGKVYKGWLEEKASTKSGRSTVIAVKKLNSESLQGFEEWQSEVNFLGRLSHPNLVKLLGYCWEEKELLLVYEFMQKGSLENHIFRRGSVVQTLPWDIRLKVAIGAARGLTFLHTSEKQVIYRHFKASNILLDGSYNAKISDFGLAKLGPTDSQSHVTTRVMGTYGYAAPEYVATGHLYVKSDVFGFGVVLIEILTGLRALDTNRPSGKHTLTDWIKPFLSDKRKLKGIMDPRLEAKYPAKAAFRISQLALKCIESEHRNRPSMKDVVETLETIEAGNELIREPRIRSTRATHFMALKENIFG